MLFPLHLQRPWGGGRSSFVLLWLQCGHRSALQFHGYKARTTMGKRWASSRVSNLGKGASDFRVFWRRWWVNLCVNLTELKDVQIVGKTLLDMSGKVFQEEFRIWLSTPSKEIFVVGYHLILWGFEWNKKVKGEFSLCLLGHGFLFLPLDNGAFGSQTFGLWDSHQWLPGFQTLSLRPNYANKQVKKHTWLNSVFSSIDSTWKFEPRVNGVDWKEVNWAAVNFIVLAI